jgi:penicillin V acylase-like amidase (Ntn superfamily)
MRSLGKRPGLILVGLLAIVLALPARGAACTTFCLRAGDGVIFGKNYDFAIGYGMVVTNKRGVAKTALLEVNDRPATWVSRFGSITFNQFGRESPSGGLNEAGLVVELMWLDGTAYPGRDARPAVGTLGWIQYQLDNFGTVQEVLDHSDDVRIANVPLHYLVCDRTGASATIEFLDGKLVCHEGDSLPVPVLTNDRYDASVAYLKQHAGFGGTQPIRQSPGSLDRFARASSMIRGYRASGSLSAIDYAFDVLANVSQGAYTQWSIVYDVSKLTVYFRTAEKRQIKKVPLAAFDFSCSTPVKMLDMDSDRGGDVRAQFIDYTRDANRSLIARSFKKVSFLAHTPDALVDAMATYPETAACAE